jgi:hypothetical protein
VSQARGARWLWLKADDHRTKLYGVPVEHAFGLFGCESVMQRIYFGVLIIISLLVLVTALITALSPRM